MEDIVLQVKDVTIGDKKSGYSIVDKVNIEVKKQQIVGIVGESGCGKSMTSLAIMQLMPVNIAIKEGQILFSGEELTALKEKELRKVRGKDISMIFQEPVRALHPLHKVGKQIEESLKIHTNLSKEDRKKQTISLMKSVGIPDAEMRYDQYPHQLSGGLNQRIMIAMAIAADPSLIIADEPTTALDVTIQAQILQLLRSLRERRGVSIILISHDLAVICENCDYVYVMYCGQIVEEADVRTFFQSPKHPYTQALLSAVPVPDPTAKRERILLEGSIPSAHKPPTGCKFHTRCPKCMECCKTQAPERYEVDDGHYVYCHLYDKERREQQK